MYMSKPIRDYRVDLFYAQGDELATFLDAYDGDVSDSFRSFGNHLKLLADRCQRIAQMTKGRSNVEAYGDYHYIGFRPMDEEAAKLLEVMAKEELIQVDEFEDDEG